MFNLEQTAEERERWRDGEKERTHVCTFTRNYKYMYKINLNEPWASITYEFGLMITPFYIHKKSHQFIINVSIIAHPYPSSLQINSNWNSSCMEYQDIMLMSRKQLFSPQTFSLLLSVFQALTAISCSQFPTLLKSARSFRKRTPHFYRH